MSRAKKRIRTKNFPVASYPSFARSYRPAILAYYRFARAADDVADHPALTGRRKNHPAGSIRGDTAWQGRCCPGSLTTAGSYRAAWGFLRAMRWICAHCFSAGCTANIVTQTGTISCTVPYVSRQRRSGGSCSMCAWRKPSTWPASDVLCSALQIINHLQDCKADYQRLNRIYIPLDTFVRHGVTETTLAEAHASTGLHACIAELAEKTLLLLHTIPLSKQIKDGRLALEVLIIEKVARSLLKMLLTRDPLSERVHLTTLQFISIIAKSLIKTII